VIGYDIDGVVTKGLLTVQHGYNSGMVIISGRTFAEYDDLARRLASLCPVYIRGVGEYGDVVAAGEFKAMMIKHLGVDTYYEDDPLQASIIRKYCPLTVVVEVGENF
jgi:hypothetical protein